MYCQVSPKFVNLQEYSVFEGTNEDSTGKVRALAILASNWAFKIRGI
jgi:hypothetical protein